MIAKHDNINLAVNGNEGYPGFEAYMDEFFGDMEITEEQMNKRKEVARDLRDALLFLFILAGQTVSAGITDYAFILTLFYDKLKDIGVKYAGDTEYIEEYATKVSNDIFAFTMLHISEEYATSDERADGIAVNEANTIMNYEEMGEALDGDYKYKTWHTMEDRKVRRTHRKLDKKTIPINDYFEVGNSLLLFPRDEVNCDDAADIANCRCTLTYS